MTIKPKGKIALLAILGIVLFFVASRFIDTKPSSNGNDSNVVAVDSSVNITDTLNINVSTPTSPTSVPVVVKQSETKVLDKPTQRVKSQPKKSDKPKEPNKVQPKKSQTDERENLNISNF